MQNDEKVVKPTLAQLPRAHVTVGIAGISVVLHNWEGVSATMIDKISTAIVQESHRFRAKKLHEFNIKEAAAKLNKESIHV